MYDAVDIRSVQFVNTYLNPQDYAPTLAITAVEFDPARDKGVRLVTDRALLDRRWPSIHTADDQFPANIQWTLFAGFSVNGRVTLGAMHEMWGQERGAPREWTGAHPLELNDDQSGNNFATNWAYRERWGALYGYIPSPGEVMFFLMVAGAVRGGSSSTPTVAERSQLVAVPLQRQGVIPIRQTEKPPVVEPPPIPEPTPTPVPVPVPVPVPAPAPTVDVTPILVLLTSLKTEQTLTNVHLQTLIQAQRETTAALDRLIEELK